MPYLYSCLIRRKLIVLAIVTGCAGLLFSKDTFVSISPEVMVQYRLDFAKNFFPTLEAEKADRIKIDAALQELQELRAKIQISPKNLEDAFTVMDRIQVLYRRHYAYLYLRNSVNRKDETSLADSSSLSAQVTKETAFFRDDVMHLNDETVTAFLSERPSLMKYRFAIETVRRYRPFTLTLKEEELLSATAPMINEWQYDLYTKLIDRTNFGTVHTSAGDLDVWKQRRELAGNPDRSIREQAFKKRYAGFFSQADLYAFTLMRLANARTQLAQLHHFKDAASSVYFDQYWTKEEVTKLLQEVAAHADLNKRYQKILAEHVKRLTGYEDVSFWDLPFLPKEMQPPQFTIQEASKILKNALLPLGTEYQRELVALLDPANGRMDIVSGQNRKSGGFSEGFIGTASVFYTAGFTGSYNDLRVLTHESTHAVQRQLMNSNNVLPAYADGPHYLYEAAAIFNEFLLPDYLYQQENDPLRKQFYLEKFLDTKGMVMFEAGPEAVLEESIYDGVEHGKIHDVKDLDDTTQKIYTQFSIWPAEHDEMKHQWMNVPLMYEDPFYDINYVYGSLLALKFYDLYKRDAEAFAPKYIALLKNGFDAPPATLLKTFLDLDLKDPHLVSDAARILQTKVDLLEKNYQSESGSEKISH